MKGTKQYIVLAGGWTCKKVITIQIDNGHPKNNSFAQTIGDILPLTKQMPEGIEINGIKVKIIKHTNGWSKLKDEEIPVYKNSNAELMDAIEPMETTIEKPFNGEKAVEEKLVVSQCTFPHCIAEDDCCKKPVNHPTDTKVERVEEAAGINYYDERIGTISSSDAETYRLGAKFGAKWQKSQPDNIESIYTCNGCSKKLTYDQIAHENEHGDDYCKDCTSAIIDDLQTGHSQSLESIVVFVVEYMVKKRLIYEADKEYHQTDILSALKEREGKG